MTAFIDKHRAMYGVEPICRVLPIAPSTYYTHAARQADPERQPARWHRQGHLAMAPSRLLQPSGETLLGLSMGRHTTCGDRLFAAGNALKHCHALLNVHQVGTGKAMLSDEDRLLVPLKIREKISGLALEGSDEFGTHKVALQYHLGPRKCLVQRPNTGIKPCREAASA